MTDRTHRGSPSSIAIVADSSGCRFLTGAWTLTYRNGIRGFARRYAMSPGSSSPESAESSTAKGEIRHASATSSGQSPPGLGEHPGRDSREMVRCERARYGGGRVVGGGAHASTVPAAPDVMRGGR